MFYNLSLFVGITAIVLSISSARADDMSDMADWCANVTAPSNVVICSDPELRRMAVVRNKIFEDARANFSDPDMKAMNAEQKNWVREYTTACGASVDGPPVSYPIRPDIVDCFKREGRERIAALVREMREDIPNYQAPSVSGSITYTYQDLQRAADAQRAAEQRAADAQRIIDAQRAAEQKEAEMQRAMERAAEEKRAADAQRAAAQRTADAQRIIDAQRAAEQKQAEAQRAIERAAEDTRRQLQGDAAREKLIKRLQELGFQLLTPVDLNLDWKTYMASKTKIAIDGTYVQADDVEVLSTPDNKDQPTIWLNTTNASRDARKLMLECRNSGFKIASCQMVVGATIQSCLRNKGQLNEKEIPCLRVQEAFVKG